MQQTIARWFFSVFCFAAFLAPLHAQSPDSSDFPASLTFDIQDLSLRDALQSLQSLSGIDIVFRDADVDSLFLSQTFTNQSFETILQQLLSSYRLTFRRINDRQVVVIKKALLRRNIKGYVIDAGNGEPLPYANVALVGTSAGTFSNPDGYFVLVDIPDTANQTLRVDYLGYTSGRRPIFSDFPDSLLVIRLSPHTLRGEAVTVTSGYRELLDIEDMPAQVQVSTEALSLLPVAGDQDIFRSLQLLPGINNISDVSSGLYIRGGTPEQNLILLDGITIYHLDHFFGFFSAFNPQAVKNIRVLKGGFPAQYGGRTAGVVELSGKSGDPGRVHAGIGANLMSGNAYASIPLKGKGALFLAARRSYSDILQSPAYRNIINTLFRQDPDDSRRPLEIDPLPRVRQIITDPEFSFYDFNAKLTLLPTEKDVLSMSLYRSQDHLTDVLIEPANDGSDTLRNQIDSDWGNRGISGKWSRQWNDRFYSNLLLAYSEYRGSNNSADTYFFSDRFTQDVLINQSNSIANTTSILNTEWHLNAAHKIDFGGAVTSARVRNHFDLNDTLEIVNQQFRASEASLYFQDRWSPAAGFQTIGGIRAVYYRPNNTYYAEPRLTANVKLHPRLNLKGAWGHYHQFVKQILNEDAVVGIETYTYLSSERLKPDFAEHYILGLSTDFGAYSLNLEGYYKRLSNLNEFSLNYRTDTGADLNSLLFNGEGRTRGIELLLRRRQGRLTGWASYALSRTTQRFTGKNNGLDFPAPQDQKHEIKLVGNLALGKLNLAANWVFTSGRPFSAPGSRFAIRLVDGTTLIYLDTPEINGRRLREYHRLDLSATMRFTLKSLKYHFGISVFNVYNRDNVWYRRYLAESTPVVVRDITLLGITPTVILNIELK